MIPTHEEIMTRIENLSKMVDNPERKDRELMNEAISILVDIGLLVKREKEESDL